MTIRPLPTVLAVWIMGLLSISIYTLAEEAKTPAAEVPKAKDALHPLFKMETTLGDIILELDAEKAPISTFNFLTYSEEKYYEGTIFHRVIPTFMIQGGGLTPGMEEKKAGLHPPIRNEWRNGLKNVRGTIAMARTNEPDSATSQFFINVVDNAMLDESHGVAAYAVFGKVVGGMDVVDKIKSAKLVQHPKYPPNEGPVNPDPPVIIKSVKPISEISKDQLAAKAKEAEGNMKKAEEEAAAKKDQQIRDVVQKYEEKYKGKFSKTPSGLQYLIVRDGSGNNPKPSDTVEVSYLGTFVNGEKFAASADHGGTVSFQLSQVIPGWSEGVGLMKPGGKLILVCPPHLAYGKRGVPGRIPPDSTLVFEIELASIK